MAGIVRLFKKTLKRGTNVVRRVGSVAGRTLKRGTNVVRRVGKVSRRTLRRGTNAVGLTKKRRSTRRR